MAPRSAPLLEWEAPEHHHIEKGSDWYWALGIIAAAGAGVSIVLGNILFAIVIALGATLMGVVSLRGPILTTYAITPRGIRVDDELYPFSTLASFCIDEDDPRGPQLLLRSAATFSPLVIMPIPDEHTEDIDAFLSERLPEEHLEESLAHRLLELVGF